jgi:hypothetical protein
VHIGPVVAPGGNELLGGLALDCGEVGVIGEGAGTPRPACGPVSELVFGAAGGFGGFAEGAGGAEAEVGGEGGEVFGGFTGLLLPWAGRGDGWEGEG